MRAKRETRDTTRLSTTVVTFDDDDRRRDILRARTGAPDRLLLLRRCARFLLAMHLPEESPVGTWTAAAACPAYACDGRWECLVKPANCYRFIGTHGVRTCPKEKRIIAEDHSLPWTSNGRAIRYRADRTDDLPLSEIPVCHNYATIMTHHIYDIS